MIVALLFALLVSTMAHANDLSMTCGEVLKARNGKLGNRLEPSFFGINDKFVLATKFKNHIEINELPGKPSPIDLTKLQSGRKLAFTQFSDKIKFRQLKSELKAEVKKSQEQGTPLYACVGHIRVPMKYSGSHMYLSHESVDVAVAKMRKQAKRHAW